MADCIEYHLPQIPYLQLRFKLSAQKEAHLPRFKGSLLRGAFGHALRRMVCVMGPGELCENCMLRLRNTVGLRPNHLDSLFIGGHKSWN